MGEGRAVVVAARIEKLGISRCALDKSGATFTVDGPAAAAANGHRQPAGSPIVVPACRSTIR